MAIDFNDPAQVTHQNERIPIDNQQMYDAGLAMMKSYHAFYGVKMDSEALGRYEQRVRQGENIYEIEQHFGEDMVSRYNVVLQK